MPNWCPICCFIRLDEVNVAILDPDDWVRLHHYNWFAEKKPRGVYAYRRTRRRGRRVRIYMHREIAGTPVGMETHHKNGIKLDNRKMNLDIVTPQDHRFISRGKTRKCHLSDTVWELLRCGAGSPALTSSETGSAATTAVQRG